MRRFRACLIVLCDSQRDRGIRIRLFALANLGQCSSIRKLVRSDFRNGPSTTVVMTRHAPRNLSVNGENFSVWMRKPLSRIND